jgi:RNA polymerase sigma-70 factor, ECF subfamily
MRPRPLFLAHPAQSGTLLTTSEDELIQQALSGSGDAYGLLVERYQDRLFNAMLHIVGSADEAEDIVQDSFVQAYVKLDTFRGQSRFFTWLYRIAFNNALSRRRKRRVDASIEQGREATGGDPVDRHEAPEEPLLRQERVATVTAALQRLSEEHRAILVLREMQDLPYEEIAEILSINIGTVRSRLSRARNQLHDLLKEMLDD